MAALTGRERQIVLLLTQGKRMTDIARELGISYATVQQHVETARLKTFSRTTYELAAKAAISTHHDK